MGKSKIKQNPYAQLLITQQKIIQEQVEYMQKNPKELMKWVLGIMMEAQRVPFEDRWKVYHELEKK